MSGSNEMLEPNSGCFFADPRVLPGNYINPPKVDIEAARKYAKRIRETEHREVTFDEMQKFVKK